MKQYTEYKETGVKWIGSIPKHWKMSTVGRYSILGRGRVISAIEIEENKGEYPVYSSQTENKGILGFIDTYDFEGDYVTWTTDGANAGTVSYRTGKFNCTNVCGTIHPLESNILNLQFLPYLLNLGTKIYVRQDINPKLMNGMMSKLPLLLPPIEEQTAIANFLDLKTQQIDDLIAKKERLIELLKEERTAVINQAVTKGLDPDVQMKDSGIEWLGEIPEHWEVKKLKMCLTKIGSGVTPRGGSTVYLDEGIALIRSQNVKFEGLDLEDVAYISEEINATMKNSQVLNGDILLNITGASIGRCCTYDTNDVANVNQHVCILRVNDENIHKFINAILRSTYGQNLIRYFISGSGREGLNFQNIGSFKVCLPNKSEQESIVDYIETQHRKLDLQIENIDKQITLLNEYKTSIINEAVTGKILVPDVN